MTQLTKLLTVLGSISTVAIFTVWHSSKASSLPVTAAVEPALKCRFSGEYWHGDKVYALANNSTSTLQHVTIVSWSEQILPILKITSGNTSFMAASVDSALSPPNQLRPHQVAWFVGPRASSVSMEFFSVIWQNNGEAYYENIKDKP